MGGVCVSELENWQCEVLRLLNVDKIVPGLSEVGRGFMFCESSFLGVRKLQEGCPCSKPSRLFRALS